MSTPGPEQTLLSQLATLQARVDVLENKRHLARRRSRLILLSLAVALISAAGVAGAADGDCPLPFCFAANSPARASR
jgi:hypothetical protein